MPKESLGMIIALKDTMVPTINQEKLHQAFGQPKAHFVNGGHFDAILNNLLSGSKRKKIALFFKERMALDNPRPPLFPKIEEPPSSL